MPRGTTHKSAGGRRTYAPLSPAFSVFAASYPDMIAQTATEVEPVLSPRICEQRLSPLHALMRLVQGVSFCLMGSQNISTSTRSDVYQTLLLAWGEGKFKPSPLFPYSYEEVMGAFQQALPRSIEEAL